MTISDTIRTPTVPQQAGPAGPPLPPQQTATAAAPLLGSDRPLSAEERQFVLALVAMVLVLGTVIVTGLLVAQHVWS